MAVATSALGKQISAVTLDSPLSGGGGLPCNLSSLRGPRKITDFLFQLFLVIRMTVAMSKLFTC